MYHQRTCHLRESLNYHFSLLLVPEKRVSLLDSYLDSTALTNQSTPCLKVLGTKPALLQGNSPVGVMVRFVYVLLVFVCMISSNTQDICLDGGHYSKLTCTKGSTHQEKGICKKRPSLSHHTCIDARRARWLEQKQQSPVLQIWMSQSFAAIFPRRRQSRW